jgi:hypothetical protein
MSEKKVDESWKDAVDKEKVEPAGEEETTSSPEPQETETAGASESDQAKVDEVETGEARVREAETEGFPPIQASFLMLITELAMQASLFMGEIPHPETNEPVEDLNRAKYLIDELGVLEEKTKGNLTPEESAALGGILYDLRMKFVEKSPKT